MNGKFFLYFYYDKEDNLLYIGKAVDVWTRWNGHNEYWKKDICKIGVYECVDRAAMDVLECYYIAKMPTLYNKTGIAHGYTVLDIPNLEGPTVYSVEEFMKYFRPKKLGKQLILPLPPLEEQIRALGNTIIEIDGFVDLYDESLLQLDLDRVYFKYKDKYLVSRFSVMPGEKVRKRDQLLSYRTNKCIREIKQYLNSQTLNTWTENGVVYHSFEVKADTEKECCKIIEMINDRLYTLYEKDTYWRGEKMRHVGSLYPQIRIYWDSPWFEEKMSGVWLVNLTFVREEDQWKQPQISNLAFSYDINKLYAEIMDN